VEYPFANGAVVRVFFSSKWLKFNGDDCFSVTVSEPTELATASDGVLALLMNTVVSKPGVSRFQVRGWVGPSTKYW
jgi:hypothetical protein